MSDYLLLENPGGKPIKAWVRGVPFDSETEKQLREVARMPFIYRHVAVMPDCHVGKGSTVGCVLPTQGAVIPAAVGVDIGCGMVAVCTSLKASDLPDDLAPLRAAIESVVPVGTADWSAQAFRKNSLQRFVQRAEQHWQGLIKGYQHMLEKHPQIEGKPPWMQLGTLGGGNHFIEMCLDQAQRVWLMLHSGSRGIGNRIGNYFIEVARQEIERRGIQLPNRDLAYLVEGVPLFEDYIQAVEWAQHYAYTNREIMLQNILTILAESTHLPGFQIETEVVNCHHNYIAREYHSGASIWVTRKGAIRARAGDLGIIPGSMGARSYIVRGKGHPESFHSCSHGAGRTMSRTQAKQRFSLEEHRQATAGVECRKDWGVIDETPAAYKNIEAVMQAQQDLVEIVYTLKQVVCVKG